MDRSLPIVNKHLQKKWDSRLQDLHQENLKKIKSRIDSKSPNRYSHILKNAKKEQQQEDRYTEIERENRILLEKMSKVIKNKAKSMSKINKSTIVKNISRRQPSFKLYKENIMLAKRLQSQSSVYKLINFEEDVREHEELLNRISDYPYRITKTKSFHKSNAVKKKTMKDEIVYMRAAFISKKKFDVEIYKSGKNMIILVYDHDEVHKLNIPWTQAQRIMETGMNYDKIIEKLRYENSNIVLVE